MGSKIPLFPVEASSVAGDVDHLALFLIAVAVFFTVAIFASIFYFAIRYRRRSERELPHVAHGGMVLEIVWVGDSFCHHHGDVHLGSEAVLPGEPSAR